MNASSGTSYSQSMPKRVAGLGVRAEGGFIQSADGVVIVRRFVANQHGIVRFR